MNLTTKETSGICTVKELREFLDKHEAKWSEEDEHFLGSFDSQKFLLFLPKQGYTFSKFTEAYECGGFFVVPTDQKGEELNE